MAHQQDERGDPLTRTHDPDRKHYAAEEARQGHLGRRVLKILAVSLALALLIWGIVEIWGQWQAPADLSGTSRSTTTPDSTETQNTIENTAPTDRDPTSQSGTGGDSQRVTPDGTTD